MNAKPSSRARGLWIAGLAVAAVLLARGASLITLTPEAGVTGPTPAQVQTTRAPDPTLTPGAGSGTTATPHLYRVRNVKIYDLDGQLAYQGDVDLKPTFDRIAAGIRDPHRDDGLVFQNRERRLPIQSDREYYREYVVRTPGLSAVGPQRLVLGKDGDGWYTPDHYESFIRVK